MLVPTFGADRGKWGIGRYLVHLLEELGRLNAPAELLTFPADVELFRPEQGDFALNLVNPCFRSLPLNLLWCQTALPFHCRRHRVLFLPSVTRRFCWWAPCPIIGTVHDLGSLEGKYDPLRNLFNSRVLPTVLRRLDHILTVSEYSRREIIERAGVAPEKITVTPNGVNTRSYTPGCRQRARELTGLNFPYLLYVSRIEHPSKNHLRLLGAFEKLKAQGFPHHLVLVGTDFDRAEVVHQAHRDMESREHVHFLGFADDSVLPDLYRGADLFVFPSLFEGFGLPVLEAMASGVPVVVSNASSLPEVAGKAAVYFDPQDEDAIQTAIGQVLNSNNLRESLMEKGLARSRQYSWANTARITLDVLEEYSRR